MADIEADALRGAAFGEREEVLVLDDAAAGLAVEAMGDDVAGGEDFEHLVESGGGSPTCTIKGSLQDFADLLRHLDRGSPRSRG